MNKVESFGGIMFIVVLSIIVLGVFGLAVTAICINDFEGYYLKKGLYADDTMIMASFDWQEDTTVGRLSNQPELWEWIKANDLHLKKE